MKHLIITLSALALLQACSEQTEEQRTLTEQNWPEPEQSAFTADVPKETPEAIKKLMRETNEVTQPYLDKAKEEGQKLLDQAKQAIDTE